MRSRRLGRRGISRRSRRESRSMPVAASSGQGPTTNTHRPAATCLPGALRLPAVRYSETPPAAQRRAIRGAQSEPPLRAKKPGRASGQSAECEYPTRPLAAVLWRSAQLTERNRLKSAQAPAQPKGSPAASLFVWLIFRSGSEPVRFSPAAQSIGWVRRLGGSRCFIGGCLVVWEVGIGLSG